MKFIKWNTDIIEILEVFHIKKLFDFKICCIFLGHEESYFIPNCACKDIGKFNNRKLKYVKHKLENAK